ncbi:hypothetical protein LINGRAHAP2_LOCUS19355 [Linum grandiflorum]
MAEDWGATEEDIDTRAWEGSWATAGGAR